MTSPTTSFLAEGLQDRTAAWDAGISFEAFLPTARKNVDLWHRTFERATTPSDVLDRLAATGRSFKWLVLSADWCGDASNTVPVLARIAVDSPNVDLRLLDREDHLELMDEHLTNGRSRSIPVVIVLDETGAEIGWWGPRPAELQAWVMTEGMTMESDARYVQIRKWYARDKGRGTIDEVVSLCEAAREG